MSFKNHTKNYLKNILPLWIQKKIKKDTEKIIFEELLHLRRHVDHQIPFKGTKLNIVDGPSTYFMFNEIFLKEVYKIKGPLNSPYIIDCGANIGLSVIYFLLNHETPEVVAFEPDVKIFNNLKHNVSNFLNLGSVSLLNSGVWLEDTRLSFYAEGSDGGRVIKDSEPSNVEIKVEKLSKYINKKVDFLKIDIEGAELEVLREIQGNLHFVERIFVEYHSFVGKHQGLAEIICILESAGFRLYMNSPGLKNERALYEVKSCSGMDMQLNIFGIRERIE